MLPFDLRFAQLTTALGGQLGHQKLTAPGDVPGPFSGLYDPNDNRASRLRLQRVQVQRRHVKAQVAGRIENVHLNGTVPNDIS